MTLTIEGRVSSAIKSMTSSQPFNFTVLIKNKIGLSNASTSMFDIKQFSNQLTDKRLSSLAIKKSTIGLPKPVVSNYPIIPRIRTILPHPLQVPHPGVIRLISDVKTWCKSIASRSIVDDKTRQYIAEVDRNHVWDTPCMYMAFSLNPNCEYKMLFELSKTVVMAQLVDDLVEHQQEDIVQQELYDYMIKFQENPDLTHDVAGDSKRHFWINMLNHSVAGLRAGGLSQSQIKREINALERYTKIAASSQRQTLDWSNYWSIRLNNGGLEMVSIPAESVGGVDLPQQLLNDPEVRIVMDEAHKLTIITNDLVSYFRERDTDENSFNFITFLQKQMRITVQEAVDRCAEHVVTIHNQWVSATKAALRSTLARKFPQLDPFLKYVVPRYTYGAIASYEVLNRNRMDRQRPDYNRLLKTTNWTCDHLFVNNSDPNNEHRQFSQYVEKYRHIKDKIQEFL